MFLKIKSPADVSYDIYPKDYENAEKIQKVDFRGWHRAPLVLL